MEIYCEIKTEEGVLRGMMNRPKQKKYPLVILLHGFTASRLGPCFAFVRLACELEKQGIGSMRFDFLGSGESDGDFKEMTYMSECKQAIYILEEVKKLKEVKVLDKLLIDELIEDIVIDENRNIKVIFKCEDKYFEALDFIKRQNHDIISSS